MPLAVLTADTQAAIDQLRADARAAAEASRAASSESAYAGFSAQSWRELLHDPVLLKLFEP